MIPRVIHLWNGDTTNNHISRWICRIYSLFYSKMIFCLKINDSQSPSAYDSWWSDTDTITNMPHNTVIIAACYPRRRLFIHQCANRHGTLISMLKYKPLGSIGMCIAMAKCKTTFLQMALGHRYAVSHDTDSLYKLQHSAGVWQGFTKPWVCQHSV